MSLQDYETLSKQELAARSNKKFKKFLGTWKWHYVNWLNPVCFFWKLVYHKSPANAGIILSWYSAIILEHKLTLQSRMRVTVSF